MRFKSRFYK